MNSEYKISSGDPAGTALPPSIQSAVEEFVQKCAPIEKTYTYSLTKRQEPATASVTSLQKT